MAGPASHRDQDPPEPQWVIHLKRNADPLTVYAETYSAMSDGERVRPLPRRWLRGAAPALLVLAVGVALMAIRPERPGWLGLDHTPAVAPRALPPPRSAYAPEVIGTTPARPKAALYVGDVADFAVAAAGPELRYSWTVDGAPVGTGPTWTYAPRPAEVGRRH
ncbi:MAG TPA: hypothetical protein VKA21_13930, partial [Candidatus Binatia bacterium]|nr:hypothetical protein [Candidatus Binatia bacterium]